MKKVLIIAIIILIVCAVGFGAYKVSTSYLFNSDGTITDGKKDLINRLKSIENETERKEQIDFSLEQNLITQKEANELY